MGMCDFMTASITVKAVALVPLTAWNQTETYEHQRILIG